ALVDAEDAQLSRVGIVADLEYVGEHVVIGLEADLDPLAFGPLAKRWRVSFERARQQTATKAQQFAAASAGQCRGKTDRNEMALTQRLAESIVQRLRVDLLAVEIARHERLVDLHHLIENFGMGVGDRKDVGLAVGLETTIPHGP